MKKKKAPKWFRCAYLGLAILMPVAIWDDYKDCQQGFNWGAYGETTWNEVLNGRLFVWAIWAFLCASFLYNFIILTWNKNNDKDISLFNNLFSTAILLVWACFPLVPLAAPIHSAYQGMWVIGLVLLIVLVGRRWVTMYEHNMKINKNQ